MDMVHLTFYEKMVGNVSLCFADLIVVSMRIEHGLKNGKIPNALEVSCNAKKPPRGFQKERLMLCLVFKEETSQEGNNNSNMLISSMSTLHSMLNNRI